MQHKYPKRLTCLRRLKTQETQTQGIAPVGSNAGVAQEDSAYDARKFIARRLDAWTDQFLRKEKHDETWWMKNVFTKDLKEPEAERSSAHLLSTHIVIEN